MRMNPATSPPLGLVAPFLVLAPLGLFAAGLLLATTNADSLGGINVPRNVAATHATVIGGLTTAIMGAVYQLGPAVLGGRLVSQRLARVQFGVHAVSVPAFVWALLEWNVTWMSIAAIGVLTSLVLFLINAVAAVGLLRPNTVTRAYLSAALVMLVITASLGVTWVGTLAHLWFPVTLGRLSGHAHIGLLGWLGLTVMGVSYQLVPMFNVVQTGQPRFARAAFFATCASALVGGLVLMTDPGRAVRLVVAGSMAVGPTLWGVDMLWLLTARSRRSLDVQGKATFVSLGFLGASIALGLVVAVGEPLQDNDLGARWQLAYGICGIGGWAGIVLVGNSYKILSFLVWYHRYRNLAGRGRVPMISDVYNDRHATIVLGLYAGGLAVMAAGAVLGELAVLRVGAVLLTGAATGHLATLGHILFAPHSAATARSTMERGALS
ncbi:MAG: hypothetical protein ABI782_08605 [Anaerolineaceae bacterium]